jgi:hypothetical protein
MECLAVVRLRLSVNTVCCRVSLNGDRIKDRVSAETVSVSQQRFRFSLPETPIAEKRTPDARRTRIEGRASDRPSRY